MLRRFLDSTFVLAVIVATYLVSIQLVADHQGKRRGGYAPSQAAMGFVPLRTAEEPKAKPPQKNPERSKLAR